MNNTHTPDHLTRDAIVEAQLNAVGIVRTLLPGHGTRADLAALEPDNLASAMVTLGFLAECYARLLQNTMPAEQVEVALDEATKELIRIRQNGPDNE